MLFNCIKSTVFWDSFVKCWYQKFNQNVNLTEHIILYGWHQKMPYSSLLNYAILIAIPYFRYRHMNGSFDFGGFLFRLKNDMHFKRNCSSKQVYWHFRLYMDTSIVILVCVRITISFLANA